jgi:type IV secretion system protein VirD4
MKSDLGESGLAKIWIAKSIGLGILTFFLLLLSLTSIFTFVRYGVSAPIVNAVGEYWLKLINPADFFAFHEYWIANVNPNMPVDWRLGGVPAEIITAILGGVGLLFVMLLKNPYSLQETMFGSARLSRHDDVVKMKLFGNIIVLGEWRNKLLQLSETLSVLCVAPPGTGKTVAIVVPTILTCDTASIIVNDVKPELFDLTSGYRSKHSVCLKLEWAAQDDPEKGIFYPRWNPLSPLCMPPQGPNRDLYIDRLTNVIIEEPAGQADPHWTKKGRAAMAGFMHYIVAKCESGNYKGIPEEWVGCEASIPMLIDWMTEGLLSAADKVEALKKSNPMAAMTADVVKDFLMDAVKEAREYGYSGRAVNEFTQLAQTPDKERGSILSSLDGGLIVFKNSAIRARTEKSDFSFMDVRGITDPTTGQMKPLSLYLCVNQEDARALGKITGLLVEALSAWLVAHKPGATTRDGQKVGPCDAIFVLDEFPQMPKLQALLDGPAVGRGQRVSYLMIGQDLGQIQSKYGKDETETVISTTAAKVVLTLNNEVTAKRFSEMVGQRTLETKSKSRTIGLSKQTNPFAVNMQRSMQGQPLIRPEDFMSIEPGKHYVLMQSHMNKPILCDTPAFFKHKTLKYLVAPDPARGGVGKYPPAPTMPEFMRQKRIEEHKEIEQKKRIKEAMKQVSATAAE